MVVKVHLLSGAKVQVNIVVWESELRTVTFKVYQSFVSFVLESDSLM